DGETVSDILAAVLEREVRLDQVPARVRTLLSVCLERDPRKRLRDIGDAWRLLDFAPGVSVPPATAPPVRSRRLALLTAALAVALVVALIPAVLYFQRPGPEKLLKRLEVDLGAEINLVQNAAQSIVVLSPDGTRLLYTSVDRVSSAPPTAVDTAGDFRI